MTRALENLRLPVQYLEIGASVVRTLGGDVDAFYGFFGISKTDLAIPGMQVDAGRILQALAAYVDDTPAGAVPSLRFMHHFPITAHGPLGMLMLTNRNLGEALDSGTRYAALVSPVFRVRRQDIGDKAHFIVERVHDLGRVNDFMTELALMSVFKLMPFLAKAPAHVNVHFSHAPAGSPDEYQRAFPAHFHFNSRQDKIVFHREDLKIPLIAHSPSTSERLRKDLERTSAAAVDRNPVTDAARRILGRLVEERKSPNVDHLAQQMLMSVRTLGRRLQEEGTTAQELIVETRIAYAKTLLAESARSISEVGRQAGFSNAASFSRAFKRLEGMTPREFRAGPR